MTDSKIEKKLKELQSQHAWSAVCSLDRAFCGLIGADTASVDWVSLCRAAYHAGAAKVIQDALVWS